MAFPTTTWSIVLRARDQDLTGFRQALEKLCTMYWYPVYAYVRRHGHSVEDAEDLTQEFFARIIEKNSLRAVNEGLLVSTYISYSLLPFAQTLPPRMLTEPWLKPLPTNPVRALNLWILRHASIHANTFPSAHVAASTAAALVLATLAPPPQGLLFVALAATIAISTFAGRYHFALDAVAGTMVATIVFVAARLARL